MDTLKSINLMKNEGFLSPKIIHLNLVDQKEWIIEPQEVMVISLKNSLKIEIEDGNEYLIKEFEDFKIKNNTFYRISEIENLNKKNVTSQYLKGTRSVTIKIAA